MKLADNIFAHNVDCMEFMADCKDGEYDLAIVDPPYGIGGDSLHSGRSLSGAGKLKNRILNTGNTKWDIAPHQKYFTKLLKISKNQIVWGGNYFNLPPTRGVICWDKCQPWPNFSQWEMAWTSYNTTAKMYKYDNRTGGKIHPTQKPVALYRWLLKNYAKPDFKILDTHGGSMSIAIAFHKFTGGGKLDICEIDKEYFETAIARFRRETAQQRMFSPEKRSADKQMELLK